VTVLSNLIVGRELSYNGRGEIANQVGCII